MTAADDVLLETRLLVRDLGEAGAKTRVLHGVSISVRRGELLALTGHSGSGKSTLLYLLGAIDRPDSGTVLYEGRDVRVLDDDERAAFRGAKLGFVFQFHFPARVLDCREHRPADAPKRRRARRREGAGARGARLGRPDPPSRIAGPANSREGKRRGPRSRARRPTIPKPILADEADGSLDTKNAEVVFKLLTSLVRERGATVVVVTHDPDLAATCDRHIAMRDGRVMHEVHA